MVIKKIDHPKDVKRIQNVCFSNGYYLDIEAVISIWEKHSNEFASCWLHPAEDDKTLWEDIKELVKDKAL